MARIALVHDVAGVAASQAKLLREAGHEVDQIELSMIGASWSWPAKALAIPIRVAAYLPVILRLRRGGYEIVHIHWLTHGLIGVFLGRPFFVQAHGSDLHVNLDNPLLRLVTRAVLNRAALVFYVTPNLKAYLAGYEDKIRYLPNPVDVDSFVVKAPPTEVANVVIFTRIDPVKGVGEIFKSVQSLSQMVKVTAMDWGPLARDYVRNFSVWVTFERPFQHSQVGEFLQRFDLVIGQMLQGILGLSEIEAMAAGRPVVTGMDAALYAADPPPVVPVSNADGIVIAVSQLKFDAARLAELCSLGREWARRNHGFARHLEVLEASYFGNGPA